MRSWAWSATGLFFASSRPAEASNDRFEDYILCTGSVATAPNVQSDGVWLLLDYRSGKLLGTVIDRNLGKIISWAEVDLVTEYGIQPRQNVHFLMTTGTITRGQAAVYLAETTTGRIGVYTMGTRSPTISPARRRAPGMTLTVFRQPVGVL